MPDKAAIEELARWMHEEFNRYSVGCGFKTIQLTGWTRLDKCKKDDYRAVAKALIERFQAKVEA